MNNTALLNDPRAKRWGNFAKVAALLTVGFFVAPFIWVALGGLLGLIVALTSNKLTKQQVMYLSKMLFLVVVVPLNAE